MTKVYIVEWMSLEPYDFSHDVEAVFSTKERAEAFAEKCNARVDEFGAKEYDVVEYIVDEGE